MEGPDGRGRRQEATVLTRFPKSPLRIASAAALAAAAFSLPGCGDAPPAARPVSSIPSKPLRPETPERTAADADRTAILQQHASDLQAMFDQIRAAPAPEAAPDPAGSPAPARPRQQAAPDPAPAITAAAPQPDPSAPIAPPAPEPAESLDTLVDRLASMLQAEDHDPQPPVRRALRLAALELLRPGRSTEGLDALERSLLPAEAAALRPVRDLLSRLGALSAGAVTEAPGADPAEIAAAVADCAERLGAERPLALPTAVLCERVESFGRYTPLPSATFAAGREHAAILYVEVEHFAQRTGPASGGGSAEWTTELAQSVDLYHDADGSLQWRRPEQLVRDSARRRRSDYYLVQRITLPGTLSVGRYNLKVTVTDRLSGRTAQVRVPIQIVADPALVQKPSH